MVSNSTHLHPYNEFVKESEGDLLAIVARININKMAEYTAIQEVEKTFNAHNFDVRRPPPPAPTTQHVVYGCKLPFKSAIATGVFIMERFQALFNLGAFNHPTACIAYRPNVAFPATHWLGHNVR